MVVLLRRLVASAAATTASSSVSSKSLCSKSLTSSVWWLRSTRNRFVVSPPCRQSIRTFASSTGDKEDDDNNNNKPSSKSVIQTQAEDLAFVSGRGIGQVIFLNDSKSGGFILGGLALSDPYLASLAAIGTVTAHLTAQSIQLDKSALDNGLWSYNGCLVGCAMAVFGPTNVAIATTSTLIGAAVTPFAAASLKPMCGTMPQWTFAFNLVTLTSLLRTRPFLPEEQPTPVDVDPSIMADTEFLASLTDGVASTTAAAAAASPPSTSMMGLLVSPLTGISQIFVVESALTGAVMVAGGIATYSPLLAAHAVGGSAVGTLTGGLLLGAPATEIVSGLWGFNSALTSMAIGVFFVHSPTTVAFSAGGAAATAAVFGAMKGVFGVYGSPCLTLPFCVTMSACYLLHSQIPGLTLASNPHSPEKNTSKPSKGGLSGL